MLLFIGTYTRSTSRGVHVARFDPNTGGLTLLDPVGETPDPTFLAIHPTLDVLYAVTKRPDDETDGLAAYAVDPVTGAMTPMGSGSAGNRGPCYVDITPDGKLALVANYSSGSVARIAINDDGTLGETSAAQHEGSSVNAKRQEAAHAHSFVPAPGAHGNAFGLVADLGMDQVLVYRLDGDELALANTADAPAGSGPRHIAFNPDGRLAYVVSELDATVSTYAWDADAATLTLTSTLPGLPDGDPTDAWAADIHLHPSGKFLYTSNRNHDSLALFNVDPESGELSLPDESIRFTPSGGQTPRNFAIDPTGRWLVAAHQDSDNVTVFAINGDDGSLKQVEHEISVPMPVCVKFWSR